jgi:hypothetical protein
MTEVLGLPDDKRHEDPAHLKQRIRETAHAMWEGEGCPEGHDAQYWLRAEELLQDETQAAYPPMQSRRNRT